MDINQQSTLEFGRAPSVLRQGTLVRSVKTGFIPTVFAISELRILLCKRGIELKDVETTSVTPILSIEKDPRLLIGTTFLKTNDFSVVIP